MALQTKQISHIQLPYEILRLPYAIPHVQPPKAEKPQVWMNPWANCYKFICTFHENESPKRETCENPSPATNPLTLRTPHPMKNEGF